MSIDNLIEVAGRQKKVSISYMKDYGEFFFNDGERMIDYILVYKVESKSINRTTFLNKLQELGLQLEEVNSLINPKLRYIKVHVPKILMMRYAEKFDIPLKKLQKTYIRPPIPKLKFMRTELTARKKGSPNYDRAEESFSMAQPKRTLRNERIIVTYNILKRVVFGPDPAVNIGIHHLLEKEDDMLAAYPSHDGPSKWNNQGDPLNDRQLLRRYWSSPTNFFKSQPLDLIERYFGDNIGLYFAWLSYYNKMLVAPIIAGTIVTILNIVTPKQFMEMDEVCTSKKLMCPRCLSCSVQNLNTASCSRYKLTHYLDSFYTVAFACFMTFWAAIYIVLWRRKQAVLNVRWNIRDSNYEEQDNRPEFENYAKHIRLSEFEEPELYIPWYIKFWRKIMAFIIVAIVAVGVGCIHFIIVEIGAEIGAYTNFSIYGSIYSALMTVLVIVIMRRVGISLYEPLVIWLVGLELPQSQTDFDNSYILKIFVFSFINNYFALIYTAFFKGRYYTHPNDKKMYNSRIQVEMETCDPSGCISDVFLDILLLITLIPLLSHSINWIFSFVKVWIARLKEKSANIKHTTIPRWEKDFQLIKRNPHQLLILYEENVVEFGFVTLFAFAFPAAPIFALLNNIIKIHIDAHSLVVKHRRPQAKRTASVGAWLDALYMMYTSNLMNYVYTKTVGAGKYTYLNYTLSSKVSGHAVYQYVLNLEHWPAAGVPNGTICYYAGTRYPPDHKLAYELTEDYFFLNFQKTVFIFVFEHLIWMVTLWISYSIPSIPNFIREKFATETMELRRYLSTSPPKESLTTMRGGRPRVLT